MIRFMVCLAVTSRSLYASSSPQLLDQPLCLHVLEGVTGGTLRWNAIDEAQRGCDIPHHTEQIQEVYGRKCPILLGAGAHFVGDDRPR
jgi:hypothetical protein